MHGGAGRGSALDGSSFIRPVSWSEALELKAERPEVVPITGGTDLMVELNFGRRRPEAMMDLSQIERLSEWRVEGHDVHIGAGVTYSRLIVELGELLPGLAMASRTVGSPQIRNRGTLGGNLATASPAGDGHPPLFASRAVVMVESVRGVRHIPIDEFFVGPKRNAMQADELIADVIVPSADGPQHFAKIGPRNAMVIATTSFALAIHAGRRQVGTGIGSAAPTPRRARLAEELVHELLDERWHGPAELTPAALERFGEHVAGAASPIDDVRGTADYRLHVLKVLGRRCLRWAWDDLRRMPS